MILPPQRLARALALLLAFVVPTLAAALPLAASVPGGVALVTLGPTGGVASPPRAWLGEQPVWVARQQGQWIAVVGIGLDREPGRYPLRIVDAGGEREVAFEVLGKRYPEQHIRLKDKGKVDLAPADAARAEAEIAQIQALKRHWRATADNDGDFILPAPGRLASRFGLRRFFNGQARAPHSGLDLALARGTPVAASAAGRVLATGDYFFNGETIFVDHGNGLISMYCHLERSLVGAGDTVAQGQSIGVSGMSGRASGPHLHWSVVLNGVMVDPQLFVGRPKRRNL